MHAGIRQKKKQDRFSFSNILFIGDSANLLTLAPYVPPQATYASSTESTIFDQVYGGQRRRPAMISLNVQWMPVNDRSGTYQWKGSDTSGRKVKTVTFFGTGNMRGQQPATKAVTPPGSDYTDAYLSAFAAKPIPTRHVHRLSTAVFANSAPIPLKPTTIPITTTSSIKTSQTRFVNVNDVQTSNVFERSAPSPSDRSSTYSPSSVPEKPTAYESFVRTQYSSPQSQMQSTNANDLQTSSSFERLTVTPTPSDRSSTYSPSFTREKPTPYQSFSQTQYSPPQSQLRSTNVNDLQTSSTFERSALSPSDRSSTYSPSFVAEKPSTYEPLSRTQYSSPQSQTFTSTYSTPMRSPMSTMTTAPMSSFDNQRTYTTFRAYPRPTTSAYSPLPRWETSYENIYKPLPPYSFQSYPPSSNYTTYLPPLPTYTPYVPFPSVPLTSSFTSTQSSTNERTVPPPSTTEKPIDRPETLLFQHDEDLRSTRIEKPSPLLTPSPQSPMVREDVKIQAEPVPSEESSTINSEPIKILENTLSKYDSLINQISEVLASVSPLSSTISSMSPGKSVLDYQLSSDNSPTLPHKDLESEPSQSSTTAQSSDTQRTKESHLIRRDSYDKIVTAISDLDQSITPPPDTQQSSSIIEEGDEEIKTPALEETPMSLIKEEENLKSNIPSLDESQTSSETKQEKEVEPPLLSSSEETPEQLLSSVSGEKTEPSSIDKYPTGIETKDDKQEAMQAAPITEEVKPSSESKEEELESSYVDESQVPSTPKEEKEAPIADTKEIVSTAEEEKDELTTISTTTEDGNKKKTTNVLPEEPVASSIEDSKIPVTTEEEKLESATLSQVTEHQTEVKTESSDDQQIPILAEEKKEQEQTSTDTEHPDVSQTLSAAEKSTDESTSPTTEQQTPSIAEENKEEPLTLSATDSEHPATVGEEKMEEITSILPEEALATSIVEEKKEESVTSTTTNSTGTVLDEEQKMESQTLSQQEEPIPPTSEQQKEVTTESSNEQQAPSVVEEKKEELIVLPATDSESPVTKEEEKVESNTSSAEQEQIKEESKTESSDEPYP